MECQTTPPMPTQHQSSTPPIPTWPDLLCRQRRSPGGQLLGLLGSLGRPREARARWAHGPVARFQWTPGAGDPRRPRNPFGVAIHWAPRVYPIPDHTKIGELATVVEKCARSGLADKSRRCEAKALARREHQRRRATPPRRPPRGRGLARPGCRRPSACLVHRAPSVRSPREARFASLASLPRWLVTAASGCSGPLHPGTTGAPSLGRSC